eukprot:scaffold10802_cov57-Attheya_sp.AAC.5
MAVATLVERLDARAMHRACGTKCSVVRVLFVSKSLVGPRFGEFCPRVYGRRRGVWFAGRPAWLQRVM